MTKHSSQDDRSRPTSPADALHGLGEPAIETLWKANETCIRACADWQQEVTRFLSERFKEDLRAQNSLTNCRSVGDVLDVQRDWAFSAAKDYFIETTRLAEIASQVTDASAASVKHPNRSAHPREFGERAAE